MDKKYRTAKHFNRCLCGKPAVSWKDGGFVCERCLALEQAREQNQLRREYAGSLRRPATHDWKDWDACDCFVCRVIEKAHELVVIGEGEYHLALP